MPYESWSRLLLWLEYELSRLGIDIEVEVTSITDKLRNKFKQGE